MPMNNPHESAGHYANINDISMYYEIHGAGRPLFLIHGGGSTIQSTFGRILPDLAKTHQVIAVELQAHGRTLDIGRPLSFEQDADDVAALLGQLQIEKADFMGFSNGGTTSLQIAIRHPHLVRKLVLASATYRRDGLPPGFFEGMQNTIFDHIPAPLKEAYLEVNPNPQGLQTMFERDIARMIAFQDIPDADIQSIQAPAFVLNGATEPISAENALALSRLLPHGQIAILPGGHGDYIGEICSPYLSEQGAPTGAHWHRALPALVTTLIKEFLNE